MNEIATVMSIRGSAFVVGLDGRTRPLKVGDKILKGETLVTGADAQVELAVAGGQPMNVGPTQTVKIDDSVSPAQRPTPGEATAASGTVDSVIQALEQGGDLNQQLEATAAGAGGGGGEGGGSGFVRLLRIAEGVDPLAFQFSTARPDITPVPEGEALLAVAPVPAPVPAPEPEPEPTNQLDDGDEENSTAEGETLTVGVDDEGNLLNNTTNPDGPQSASITTFSWGANQNVPAGETAFIEGVGSLTINADGSYTFEPAPEYNGEVPPATYTVTDGQDTNDSTLVLGITSRNVLDDADEKNSTAEDTTLTVGVEDEGNLLNNTTNPDGPQSETITQFSWGSNLNVVAGQTATIQGVGSLTINANGSYTFVPAPNYNGAVPTATYTVFDGVDTNDSSLALSITPVTDLATDPDEFTTIEGGTLQVNSVAGVLQDDTNATTVARVSASSDGGSAVTVNGVTTLTTALGGTVVMQADGTFTYQIGAIDHVGDATEDSFYYQATGAGETSVWTKVTINVLDTVVDAINDAHTLVDVGDEVTGNVLDNDIQSLDQDHTVTSVTFGGTTYVLPPDGSDRVITGEWGELTINNTGEYSYEATGKTIAPGSLAGATIYGVLSSRLATNGWENTFTQTDVDNADVVNGSKDGFGVSAVNAGGGVISQNEALVVKLSSPYSGVLEFEAAQLNTGQGSLARWTTYDADGDVIATGLFGTVNSGVATAQTVSLPEGSDPVAYVAFTWGDNNNGFVVSSIQYQTMGEDTFTYTVTDGDGDADTAALTFTGDSTTTVVGDGLEQNLNYADLLTEGNDDLLVSLTTSSEPTATTVTTSTVDAPAQDLQAITLNSVTDEQLKSMLNLNSAT